jgi:hypothetical protein
MNMLAKTMIFLIASVLLGKSAALACYCMAISNPAQGLERSRAVFTGKVIGLRDTGTYIEATIEVKQGFKGTLADQVIISTPRFGGACRYWFEEGKEYLVYASSYEEGKGWTDACSRTRRLSVANRDIRELTRKNAKKVNK